MKDSRTAKEAVRVANPLVEWMRPYCRKVEIAGSLRRLKPVVGDVEIVAWPVRLWEFLQALDERLKRGEIRKTLEPRWGDKYRAFIYQDVKFDLFMANEDNWGYIWWLRTGPADANAYVVTKMERDQSPIRFDDGLAWEVEYEDLTPSIPPQSPRFAGGRGKVWQVRKVHQLRIADEETLFWALGLPIIAPHNRTLLMYKQQFGHLGHSWPWREQIKRLHVDGGEVETHTQQKLF